MQGGYIACSSYGGVAMQNSEIKQWFVASYYDNEHQEVWDQLLLAV